LAVPLSITTLRAVSVCASPNGSVFWALGAVAGGGVGFCSGAGVAFCSDAGGVGVAAGCVEFDAGEGVDGAAVEAAGVSGAGVGGVVVAGGVGELVAGGVAGGA